MPELIASNPISAEISTSDKPIGTKHITENGVYDVSVYKNADVEVPMPEGDIELTHNNQTYDVSDKATATVNLPMEETTVRPSINDIVIRPSQGYEGVKKITMKAVTAAIDSNIQPENIAYGKNILGVNGSLMPPTLIQKSITANGTYSAEDDDADGYSEVEVAVPAPRLQTKQVTPQATQFDVEPSAGFDGLSKVTVKATPLEHGSATPAAASQTITPQNPVLGFSDFTVNATPLEAKTVTPTSQQQVVTPTAPSIGLSSVTVGAAPPPPTLITKQISANGTYSAEDDNADGYSGVTVNVPDASKSVLEGVVERSITTLASDASSIAQYAFYNWTTLASVSFLNATSVGSGAFRNCTALTTVSMPNVTTLSTGAFRDCTSLVHVEFPNLTSLSTTVFNGCSNLTALILNQRATLAGGNSIPSQTIVYVENDDLEWYSSATNWAAIYADSRIKSIDDLPQ